MWITLWGTDLAPAFVRTWHDSLDVAGWASALGRQRHLGQLDGLVDGDLPVRNVGDEHHVERIVENGLAAGGRRQFHIGVQRSRGETSQLDAGVPVAVA